MVAGWTLDRVHAFDPWWHHRRSDGDSGGGGDERRLTTMSVPDARKRSCSRSRVGTRRQVDCRWRSTLGERLPRHLADCGRQPRAALAHERTQRRSRRTAGILAGWKPSGLHPSIGALNRRSSVHVLLLSPDLTASAPPTRVASEDEVILGLAWTSDGRGLVFSSALGIFGGSVLQRVSLTSKARRADRSARTPGIWTRGALDVSVSGIGPARVLGAIQGYGDLETAPWSPHRSAGSNAPPLLAVRRANS